MTGKKKLGADIAEGLVEAFNEFCDKKSLSRGPAEATQTHRCPRCQGELKTIQAASGPVGRCPRCGEIVLRP